MGKYTDERDNDVVEEVNTIIKELGGFATKITRKRIFELAAQRPAKRFYISYEEAKKNVSLLLRNLPLATKTRLKREMYEDIAILYLDRLRQHPQAKGLEPICDIVDGEAPQFYIAPRTIEIIYNETTKRSNE